MWPGCHLLKKKTDMQVVIIEDEKIAADYLEKLIGEYDSSFQVVKKLDSVEASVAYLSNTQADLLFVDIHLADDLSFAIFEQLDLQMPVIFTTAYDQYAIRAFTTNSIDYLLKPIHKDDLHRALNKFKNLHPPQPSPDLHQLLAAFKNPASVWQERFLVSTGQKLKSVPADQVAYFYADQKLTFLTDKEGRQYIVDNSLDKLEAALDPRQFFRINRQFIVSWSSIKSMVSYSKSRVKLDLDPPATKDTIVSVERSAAFKDWLNR